MSRPIRYLLLWALFPTSAVAGDISFERDILPFGVPLEFKPELSTTENTLTAQEIVRCAVQWRDLEDARSDLRFEETKVQFARTSERPEDRNKAQSSGDPALDAQLDTLEAAEPTLEERIKAFVLHRHDLVMSQMAFDEQCASRPYKIDDVRALLGEKKI